LAATKQKLKPKMRRKRKTRKAAKTTTTMMGRTTRRRQIRISFCPIQNHFIFPQYCPLTAVPPTNAHADHPHLRTLLVYFLHWTDSPYAMTIAPRTAT
jgi:hypothetical protein